MQMVFFLPKNGKQERENMKNEQTPLSLDLLLKSNSNLDSKF